MSKDFQPINNDMFLFRRGLDLSKYVVNEEEPLPLYDLFAVSNHYGGLGGGHC